MNKNIGNIGCLVLVLVLVLLVSMMSFAFTIIFKTPVGLILLAYLIYRFYFKRKKVSHVESFEFDHEEDDAIDVDYEDLD